MTRPHPHWQCLVTFCLSVKLARFQADEIALVMDLKISFTPDTIHMACEVDHHVAGRDQYKGVGSTKRQ